MSSGRTAFRCTCASIGTRSYSLLASAIRAGRKQTFLTDGERAGGLRIRRPVTRGGCFRLKSRLLEVGHEQSGAEGINVPNSNAGVRGWSDCLLRSRTDQDRASRVSPRP